MMRLILLISFFACCIFALPGFISASSGNNRVSKTCYVTDTAHLRASVVSVIPQGSKSVLLLNRGKTHGVKTGDQGMIPALNDVKFLITEVYEVRSKAVCQVSADSITVKSAVIIINKTGL